MLPRRISGLWPAFVEAMLAADQICVIGSEEKIEENRDMFDNVTNF